MIRINITDNFTKKVKNVVLQEMIFSEWRKTTARVKQRVREVAPKNGMQLQRAVYGRTYKNPLKAVIGIPVLPSYSGFDYAQFVTNQIPITITKENKYFAAGQTINYGGRASAPSGNPIKWTAPQGWWQSAEREANREFANATRRGRNAYVRAMNG